MGVAAGRGSPTRWTDIASALDGWAQFADQQHRRFFNRRIALYVSGAIARPFVLNPVPGLKHRKEAMQIAQRIAPEATGIATPCAIWLDAWEATAPCLAVAIDLALRANLEGIARKCGLRLLMVSPWWAVAFSAALAKHPGCSLIAINEMDAVTVLAGTARENARFAVASTHAAALDLSGVRRAVARTEFGAELDGGDRLIVHTPVIQAPEPDVTALDIAFDAYVEKYR